MWLDFEWFSVFRLCRVQRRIQKGFDVFEYYANNQWDFDNANMVYMRSIMNDTEKREFPIEDKDIDVNEYFEDCIRSARKYVLNQSDYSIPAARRHMTMYGIHWSKKIDFTLYLNLKRFLFQALLARSNQ